MASFVPKGVAARYGFGLAGMTPADIQAAADKANDTLARTLLLGRPRRPEDERHDWRVACRWRGGRPCEVPAVAEVRPRRSGMTGGRAMCTAHLHAMTAQGFRVSRWLTTRIRSTEPGLLVERVERRAVVALLEADHALAPDQAAKLQALTAEMRAILDRHSCGFVGPRPTLSPKDIAAAVRALGK